MVAFCLRRFLLVSIVYLSCVGTVNSQFNKLNFFKKKQKKEKYVIPVREECFRSSDSLFKDSLIKEMFRLVNEHRIDHNSHKLSWDIKLQPACKKHSMYQAFDSKWGTMRHDEPNENNPYFSGLEVWDRTNIEMCGENVLMRPNDFNGNGSPWMNTRYKVMNAKELALAMFINWKESPGHNENMLDKRWNYMAFDYYGFIEKQPKKLNGKIIPNEYVCYHDRFLATQIFR